MQPKTLSDLLKQVGREASDTPLQQEKRYAFAYIRVSTDDQDENAQRADIAAYAEANNIGILEWFADHAAKANDIEARVEFWRMAKAAKSNGTVSLVLLWDEDRFWRNIAKSYAVEAELAEHGVEVLPIRTPYSPDTVDGHWLRGINRLKAQGESMQNRDRTVAAMKYHCQQRDPESGWCYKLGGPARFGYKVVREQRGLSRKGSPKFRTWWELDDTVQAGKTNSEWVKVIVLDWFAGKGWGAHKIINELRCLGLESARKKFWGKSSVHALLSTEALLTYTGRYAWGKNQHKALGERIKSRKRPPNEWEIVENAHEAILTEQEVQFIEREKERRFKQWGGAAARTRKSVYALTGGLTTCKRCGANMVGFTESSRQRHYYQCSAWQYRNGAGCGKRFLVRRELFETAILDEIPKRFPLDDEMAEQWAVELNRRLQERVEHETMSQGAFQHQLDEVNAEIGNITAAIRKGVLLDSLMVEAKQLEQRKHDLERQIREQSRAPRRLPTVTPKQVLRQYRRLAEHARRGEPEVRRGAIRMFVQSAWADPDARQLGVNFYNSEAWGVRNLSTSPRGYHSQ